MEIEKDMVKYVAQMARLQLSEKEIDNMLKEVKVMMSYMDKLNELDTSDVKSMEHIISLRNIFRNDNVEKSLSREKLFSNTPSGEKGYFKVPNTF